MYIDIDLNQNDNRVWITKIGNIDPRYTYTGRNLNLNRKNSCANSKEINNSKVMSIHTASKLREEDILYKKYISCLYDFLKCLY